MPNTMRTIADSTNAAFRESMKNLGEISKALDKAYLGNDQKFGKSDFCDNLKDISDKEYAEIRKVQSNIPGKKKQ